MVKEHPITTTANHWDTGWCYWHHACYVKILMAFQSQKYESFIKCMTNIRVSCSSVTQNDLNLCSCGSRILSELHKSFTYMYCYSAHIWYTTWPKAMCMTKHLPESFFQARKHLKIHRKVYSQEVRSILYKGWSKDISQSI